MTTPPRFELTAVHVALLAAAHSLLRQRHGAAPVKMPLNPRKPLRSYFEPPARKAIKQGTDDVIRGLVMAHDTLGLPTSARGDHGDLGRHSPFVAYVSRVLFMVRRPLRRLMNSTAESAIRERVQSLKFEMKGNTVENYVDLLTEGRWMFSLPIVLTACGIATSTPELEAEFEAHGTHPTVLEQHLFEATEAMLPAITTMDVPAAIEALRSAVNEMIPGLFVALARRTSWSAGAISLALYHFGQTGKFPDLAEIVGVSADSLAAMSAADICIGLQTLRLDDAIARMDLTKFVESLNNLTFPH
jgi:hypothetical protein